MRLTKTKTSILHNVATNIRLGAPYRVSGGSWLLPKVSIIVQVGLRSIWVSDIQFEIKGNTCPSIKTHGDPILA